MVNINNKFNMTNILGKSKLFCNFTNIKTPPEVVDIASLGPKFRYTSRMNDRDAVNTTKNVE